MTSPGGSEAAELLAALRASYGRGGAERIAAVTGISPRMQRHVLAGTKPGRAYVATLRELQARGTVSTPAPVRPQHVRAPGGQTVPRTSSTAAPKPAAGQYGRTSVPVAGGAGSVEAWTMPHTPGAQRGRAAVEIAQSIRAAAARDQRVTMVVTIRDPKTKREHQAPRVMHGQRAESLLRAARARARAMGLDARTNAGLAAGILGVIADMFPNRSAGQDGQNVVGVSVTFSS